MVRRRLKLSLKFQQSLRRQCFYQIIFSLANSFLSWKHRWSFFKVRDGVRLQVLLSSTVPHPPCIDYRFVVLALLQSRKGLEADCDRLAHASILGRLDRIGLTVVPWAWDLEFRKVRGSLHSDIRWFEHERWDFLHLRRYSIALHISLSTWTPLQYLHGPDLDLEPFWKKIACASCFPDFADIYIRPRIPSVAVLYSVWQFVLCLEWSPSQGWKQEWFQSCCDSYCVPTCERGTGSSKRFEFPSQATSTEALQQR